MLNNMKEPIKPKIVAPVSYQATKLKTDVNINPQLDTLRNSSAIYNNSVDNNTASSRVALARKQANRMNINNQINSLYGNKENQENYNKVALEPNYDLKIGLVSLDSTDAYSSTNLILNDLFKNLSYSFNTMRKTM